MRLLLGSASVAALLIGGGAPAAFAACSTSFTSATSAGCTNSTTISGIAIDDSDITSAIINASTGTISPNGITLTNGGTLSGGISDAGTIAGGISIDSTSSITAGTSAINITGSTFAGGISNAGTISAGHSGVEVGANLNGSSTVTISTFGGGISNAGTISANFGIWVGGLLFGSSALTISTFSGGITNTGDVSAGRLGIAVGGDFFSSSTMTMSTFAGGITNSGTISAGLYGIYVSNPLVSLGGGITNSGTIWGASDAIAVRGVVSFSGNISNSGMLMTGGVPPGNRNGIAVGGSATVGSVTASIFNGSIINSGTIAAGTGIDVRFIPTFAGGITNAGLITAFGSAGIVVANFSTLTGGITNSGTISVAIGTAVTTGFFSSFAGGISNSGTLIGLEGIVVGGGLIGEHSVGDGMSSFAGGITNAGLISAAVNGIIVGGFEAAYTGDILSIAISNFSGGISNSGTISAGNYGIFLGGEASTRGGASGIVASVAISTFSDGISNSGTISTRGQGIFVGGNAVANTNGSASVAIGTFLGGITNSGLISVGGGGNGIWVGGIASGAGATLTISTFAGGISNSGTITATANGILVGGEAVHAGSALTISTFSGGITNSGAISVGGVGIYVGGHATHSSTFTLATFGGGITNSGSISAGAAVPQGDIGIYVSGVSTFGGGITNSGSVFGTYQAIRVYKVSTFAGSIVNAGTLTTPTNSTGVGISASSISVFSGSVSNSGTILQGSRGIVASDISTFSGGITNSGAIVVESFGIVAAGLSTFAGGITNSGTISLTDNGAAIMVGSLSTFAGGISNSGTILGHWQGIFVGGTQVAQIASFSGGITNSDLILVGDNGIWVGGAASGASASITISSFAGGIVNAGTILAAGKGIFVGGTANNGATVAVSIFSGGITNSGAIVARTGIVVGVQALTFSGAISNSGTISGTGGTAIDVSAANNAITIDQSAGLISGAVKLSANADQFNISGGTVAGNIVGKGSQDTINFNPGAGNTFTYADNFTGIQQANVISGTVVLNGNNTATGMTVGSAGTLAGTGTDTTAMTVADGGALAPGTPDGLGAFSIVGSLTFNAGSFYGIEIGPGAGKNSATSINGAAYLNGNGTVDVTPRLGRYSDAIYQILTPTTLSGTFAGLSVNGDFDGSITLDYATNPGDVDLDVSGSSLLAAPGANPNQQSVVNGINNAILSAPANLPLPTSFENLGNLSGTALLNLSGTALLNALSQLDGELATGAQTSAFEMTTQFLELMLDPGGGGGGGDAGGGELGFAPDSAGLPPEIALAYDSVLKAPSPATFNQRWSAWGSAFGGTSTINGSAAVGSNNVTTTTYGYAAGMDYRPDPSSVLGFALAGGGLNWGLAQGLGTGTGETFRGGLYARTHFGPAYLAGALSFGNDWMNTSRTALGHQLSASFQGQSYGLRLEGGYRFAMPVNTMVAGVTPYAAMQTQWFHTPAYSETDSNGGALGLAYGANTGNDTRSEFGARFDDLTTLDNMPLVLRAKLAWAHDWTTGPALNAAFESLPGSNFTVNGAAIPLNSALTSASAQWWFTPNWSFTAKFDGEFAPTLASYAGTGTLRFAW